MTTEREMTLEQVRDSIRSSDVDLDIYPSHKIRLEWANAIDAYLSRAADPVYQLKHGGLWMDATEDEYRIGFDNFRRILYSRPPELMQDAAIGAVVWKFIDRMNDVAECDPADRILAEFVAAVMPIINAAKESINPKEYE